MLVFLSSSTLRRLLFMLLNLDHHRSPLTALPAVMCSSASTNRLHVCHVRDFCVPDANFAILARDTACFRSMVEVTFQIQKKLRPSLILAFVNTSLSATMLTVCNRWRVASMSTTHRLRVHMQVAPLAA
ncbi:MAG: hypothetical protein BYD32DRAFT_468484 [Podila humilis]|nr:MAG: hypothetical protein BYD32DRAFT_468484 [Podila humilis]